MSIMWRMKMVRGWKTVLRMSRSGAPPAQARVGELLTLP